MIRLHSIKSTFKEKFEETLMAVLPILLIVLLLCFSIAPIPPSILMTFLTGAVLLIVGMLFFNVGVDLSMTPMGERVGTIMTKSKNLIIIILISFIMGFVITVSEPDLQVLAQQVPSIPNLVLILAVAAGVGAFLVFALLRMLFGIALPKLLVLFYLIIFALTPFVPGDFLSVAFDSGGVTTGPMTVPFILALGVGVSSLRVDSNAENDSFGLVALCSIGPILAVMLLGIIFRPTEAAYTASTLPEAADTLELTGMFTDAFPHYMGEVAIALLPIVAFFLFAHFKILHLPLRELLRILIGILYTYVGLTLFLTGVNVGFMPMGSFLGGSLAALDLRWILVPLGMLIGYYVVSAEPAVHVLSKQVYDLTAGAIPQKTLGMSLSVSVAISVGLAMLRILTGMNILCFLIPGYAIALLLMFLVPPIFTSIAFDSGGVASGPMTATFLLPMAMGACTALGGNVSSDAFGVVAMVAMTPLITIQILGLVYKLKQKKSPAAEVVAEPVEDIID